MKKTYLLIVIAVASLFTACKDDQTGVVPTCISGLTAEPQEGAILLGWNKVADAANVLYTRIDYDLNGEHFYKVVSNYANTILIEDLLARYGSIKFTVSTFSADDVQSVETATVTAQCDPVKPVETIEKGDIAVVKWFDANIYFPDEGSIAELFDGKNDTFYLTPWYYEAGWPQYVDVMLDREVNTIQFTTVNRDGYSDQHPDNVQIMVSKDGTSYTKTVYEFSGAAEIPAQGNGSWTSPEISTGNDSYK